VIETLLGPEVVAVTATAGVCDEALHPDEERCVEGAVEKRRREFAAGRACARRALARLGVEGHPLLSDDRRVPVWPEGVVGSITHCAGYCAAAVARSRDLLALGIDAETSAPLAPRLSERICTPPELEHAAALPGGVGRWAKLVFSAKESAFKCYFPLARSFLGFGDAEVRIEPEAQRFRVRLLRADAPAAGGRREARGRFAWSDTHVFTAIALRRSA
jgi:4'-phosphopantetheinyl transferase EntD